VIWNELRKHLGKGISTLPEMPVKVTDRIYQAGPAFLMTSNTLKDFSPSDEPIITLIIWAPSAGALKRAFNGDIESDDGISGIPPNEMLISPTANTWGTIKEQAKELGIKFLESASYRIMTDGAFIQKQLQSRTYRAYFRSRNTKFNEHPYVIAVTA